MRQKRERTVGASPFAALRKSPLSFAAEQVVSRGVFPALRETECGRDPEFRWYHGQASFALSLMARGVFYCGGYSIDDYNGL